MERAWGGAVQGRGLGWCGWNSRCVLGRSGCRAEAVSSFHRASLASAVALVVGNMIGTGVFGALGYQVAALPSGFVIVLLWVAGGLLAFCGAVNYAELSAAMPRSGGEYALLSELYHPGVGFVGGWVSLTAGFPAPVASSALLFSAYLTSALQVTWPMGEKLMAAGLVTVLTGAHLVSVRASGRFQTVITGAKVVLMGGLIVVGMVAGGAGEVRFVPVAGDGALVAGPGFVLALFYVMFAYAGWNAACYVAGEVEDPQRNVPRALLLGTGLVMVLYTLLNAAMLRAAPLAELAGRPDPAVVAAGRWFGPAGGGVVGLLVAAGLVSTVSAMTWTGPRVAQAMGRDCAALGFLGATTREGVPRTAVLVQYVLVLALIFSSTVEQLMIRTEFVLQVFLLLTVWGVVKLRRSDPMMERPYRAWGYPVTTVLFLAATGMIMGIMVRQRPDEAKWGAGLVMIGILVYLFSKSGEGKGKKR